MRCAIRPACARQARRRQNTATAAARESERDAGSNINTKISLYTTTLAHYFAPSHSVANNVVRTHNPVIILLQ